MYVYLPLCVQPRLKPIRPRLPSSTYTIRVIGSSSAVTSSTVSVGQQSTGVILRPSTSVSISRPGVPVSNILTLSASTRPSVSASNVLVCNSESGVIRAKVQPSTLGPILASAKLVLLLEVSNIWFGATRCKPCRPVVISEQGIKLILNDNEMSMSSQ